MKKAEKMLAKADKFKARIERIQERCAHEPMVNGENVVCGKCEKIIKKIGVPVAEAKAGENPVETETKQSPGSPPTVPTSPADQP